MTTPHLLIEELLSDSRSNQVQYKFSIRNDGDKTFHLQAVSPQETPDSDLVQVTEASVFEASEQRKKVIEGLNSLLLSQLWLSSKEFRASWMKAALDTANAMMNQNIEMILRTAFLRPTTKQFAENIIDRELDKISIRIFSLEDARSAFVRFFSHEPVADQELDSHEMFRIKVYEEKLAQLARLEEQLRADSSTPVDPGETVSVTYMSKFKRGWFTPKKYQVSVEASYLLDGAQNVRTRAISHSIRISPEPFLLSCLAMVSAIAGVFVNQQLAAPIDFGWNLVFWGPILSGAILAIVVVNIYEHTSLSSQLELPLGARAAILIGFVCGLAQQRVLEAVLVLFGFPSRGAPVADIPSNEIATLLGSFI